MNAWILLKWMALQASQAVAQAGPPFPSDSSGGGIEIKNPLGCDEWTGCIQGILVGLTILAAPVAGIMILVGGFQLMTGAGNEEKIKGAKKTITYAAVGYAIILLATGVASVIQDVLSP
jgi:hypothetical protein